MKQKRRTKKSESESPLLPNRTLSDGTDAVLRGAEGKKENTNVAGSPGQHAGMKAVESWEEFKDRSNEPFEKALDKITHPELEEPEMEEADDSYGQELKGRALFSRPYARAGMAVGGLLIVAAVAWNYCRRD